VNWLTHGCAVCIAPWYGLLHAGCGHAVVDGLYNGARSHVENRN
jgi:hypothetical protein